MMENSTVGTNAEDNNKDVVLSKEQKMELFKQENWNNISTLSSSEIVDKLKYIGQEIDITKQKSFFEEANTILFERLTTAKDSAKEKFLETGGEEKDFEFKDFDYDNYKELFRDFKSKRENFFNEKAKNESLNLEKRQNLINKIKTIVDTGSAVRFDDFKEINDEWKAVGNIPNAEFDSTYKTYHHHVERFFDLLNINKDFRDIEFKRNLKIKTDICERADALLEKENILDAVKDLQLLHSEWKVNNGPVDKEHRESIWERFCETTNKLHDKRNEYYEKQQVVYDANFNEKLALVEKVKTIKVNELNSHQNWQEQIKFIDSLRKEWSAIGRVTKEQNEVSWNSFKDAIREFNAHKNVYYKNYKKQQQKALETKFNLLKKAEEIKESTDWKETSNTLKSLQREWKNTPRPLLKEADDVWGKFRGACNHFFDRMNNHYESLKGDMVENLKQKEQVLGELKDLTFTSENLGENFAILKDFNKRWRETGQVSREDYQRLDGNFRSLMDNYFNDLKVNEEEKHNMLLKMKLDGFIDNNDFKSIDKEKNYIRKKMDTVNAEIRQYERNLEWISGSDDSPIKKDIFKKINKSKSMFQSLKNNLKFVNEFVNKAEQNHQDSNE